MTEPPHDLKRIAGDVGMDYHQLYRLMGAAYGVNEWFQPAIDARGKVAGYPPDSYPRFRWVAERKREGVSLSAIAKRIKDGQADREMAGGSSEAQTQIAVAQPESMLPAAAVSFSQEQLAMAITQLANLPAAVAQLAAIVETQRAIAESTPATPPPDDELLTLAEAHRRFGISMATLRTLPRVTDGGRKKVKRSAVRAYLQSLKD